MQWHPDKEIGFGYAMNQLEITPTNERARALQQVVVQCATAAAANGEGGARRPPVPRKARAPTLPSRVASKI